MSHQEPHPIPDSHDPVAGVTPQPSPSARREITVPTERILHHFLRDEAQFPTLTTLQVIPADTLPPPTFTGDYYLTNIGPSEEDPTFLELRFEPSNLEVARIAPELAPVATERYVYLCLLMTNERYE